jgi:hypothetical protein
MRFTFRDVQYPNKSKQQETNHYIEEQPGFLFHKNPQTNLVVE